MPAMISNAAFMSAILALSVSGVSRTYDEAPASIDISNGYAAFPLLPGMARGAQVSTCIGQSKSRAIGYVVVLEATGQSTQAEKYALIGAALDNLEAALDSLAPSVVNFIEYTIDVSGNYPIGDSQYLALIASITARAL